MENFGFKVRYGKRYIHHIFRRKLKLLKEMDKMKINGHVIYYDPRDEFLVKTLFYYEISEKLTTNTIKKFVKKDMNCVNIGANMGYYTLEMARQAGPNGKIFSFEPLESTVKILKKSIESNGYKNIEIVNKAVTNRTGTTKILVTPSNMHNVITEMDFPKMEKIFVEIVSIDDFFRDKDIHLDFILMDAEGSEFNILCGMEKTIERNPELDIIAEYNAYTLRLAGTTGDKFLDKISDLGFNMYDIDSAHQKIVQITKNEILEKYPDEDLQTINTNLYLTKNKNRFKNNFI